MNNNATRVHGSRGRWSPARQGTWRVGSAYSTAHCCGFCVCERVQIMRSMPLPKHLLGRVSCAALMVLLIPLAARAVSGAQLELTEVKLAKPNLDRGAELFRTCAGCHGEGGGGTIDGAVPSIAGQHASVIQKQLVEYRYDHRWDLRMEYVADRHRLGDAQAIADVAAYIDRLNGELPHGEGDGRLLQLGAERYTALCRSCHGAKGQGDGARSIPRIAAQHYEYLRRQIYDAVDGRRPNFSASHIRLLARLDHDDIQAIADYLSRLDGGGGGAAPERR